MSERIQNLFEEISSSENPSKVSELIKLIHDYTENTRNTLLIQNTIDLIEKLLRRIFHKEKFLMFMNKEENSFNFQELANHKLVRKSDLYGVYLRILEFLESEKSSHFKLEFERKKLYDFLIKDTLLNQASFSRFCTELLELDSLDEYTELVNSIFSYPNKVANYLESCPTELKPETFYISFLHYSLQIQGNIKEKRIENYIYLINKLVLNGQASKNLLLILICVRAIGILLVPEFLEF